MSLRVTQMSSERRYIVCEIDDASGVTEGEFMDMMGRVGLVEVPILISPDQKAWMDRMIKEGKIAIPPGGTLEKG